MLLPTIKFANSCNITKLSMAHQKLFHCSTFSSRPLNDTINYVFKPVINSLGLMCILLRYNTKGELWWQLVMHAKQIKTSSSESRGQEEAACIRVIRPMRPLQWVIYTDGRSKFLKCCSSAAITAIA